MKRMKRCCGWLVPTLVCTAGGMAGAGELAIQSFGGTGRLSFNTLNNATNYRVEWASSPAGPWTNSWANLASIPMTQAGSVTCSVPMCYRVVASVTNINIYGFEDWLSPTAPVGWAIDAGVTVAQETTTVHGGVYSIKLTRMTTSNPETDVAVASPEFYPVTVGRTYTVGMWFLDNNNYAKGNLIYSWYLDDRTTIIGSSIYGSTYTENSPNWQQLTRDTASAPSGAAYLRVGSRVYADILSGLGGFIYLDDVSIVEK
ncbi:MAG: hypothetical protein WCK89_04015 [bacterium]